MKLTRVGAIIFVLFTALTGQVLACGGEEPEYKPEAALFFRTALAEKETARGDIHGYYGATSDFEMLGGWYKLLGLDPYDSTSKEHLRYLLFESSSEDTLALEAAFANGKLGGKLKNNLAAKALIETRDRGLLDYLIITRDLDASGVFGNGWNYGGIAVNADRGFLESGTDRLKMVREGFFNNRDNTELALRYAYQYIRLMFYQGHLDDIIDFYENEVSAMPDNAVKEWCRMFYAGSLYHLGHDRDAFAAYAVVFHRSGYYNFRAQESIKWLYSDFRRDFHNDYRKMIDERHPDDYDARRKLWDSYETDLENSRRGYFSNLHDYTRPLTEDERALVNSTLAYLHGDTEQSLLSVLAMVANGGDMPANPEEFLALQMGKLSHGIFTGSQTHIPGSLDLESLLLKVAEKRPDPAYWQLAAAQLAIMRGDTAVSQSYLDLAIANNASKEFPGQLLVTQTLHEAWLGTLDDASEARLAAMLQKLNSAYDQKDAHEDFGSEAWALHSAWVGILDTVLPARYAKLGRTDRIFFCLAVLNDHIEWASSDEFFTIWRSYYSYWEYDNFGAILENPEVMPQIIDIMQNPEGPLEQYFVSGLKTWNTNILYELQGLNFVMRYDFARAAEAFNQIVQPTADDYVFTPTEALGLLLYPATVNAAWPQTLTYYTADYYEDLWSWSRTRYYDKVDLENVMTASDNSIFGWRWDGDDFAGLYETAAVAGLDEHGQRLLAYLTCAPTTFADFANKMYALQELSARDDELGAMSAYFYALAIYNMETEDRLHQRKYNWPQKDVDYILSYLARAAGVSNNDEIKARVNFISAGVIKHAQFMRAKNEYRWNFYSDEYPWDADEFRQYYEALNNFRDTIFGREVFFNCTFADDFLQ